MRFVDDVSSSYALLLSTTAALHGLMKGQGRMDLAGDLVKASDTQGTIADIDAAPLPSPTAQNSAVKARSLAAGLVDRIVAAAVPAGMHVARDARIAMQKAATISLLYLSCLADDEHSRE